MKGMTPRLRPASNSCWDELVTPPPWESTDDGAMTAPHRQARVNAKRRDELAHLLRVAMIGELSGSLAHELNQPLAAILSNAQAMQRMAAKGALDAQALNEILQDIVDDTKRAGEVIRRLRRLLRRGEHERELIDLNAIVSETLRLMRSDLVGRGVAVVTALASRLPVVRGDRVQLQQVLLNLILNACQAMEGAAGAHRLKLRSEELTEGRVRVSVIDQGAGIAPEQLGRIFEPFVTTKCQGMGLGLSVCRTIVEHHGGQIGASNNAAGGATVYFDLPSVAAECS